MEPSCQPGPNEVRLASRACCLNFNDIDIIRGRYATLMLEPPFTPGMEAVGTVESAGPGAEHLVGRRVVGIPVLAHGGYASHVVVDAATALELPGWVDDADGAALHYPFHLGWFAYCRELGADFALNYRTTDFVEAVDEITYGHGVDVAFDTVGGDVTLQTFRCMGFNGRRLIAGFSEGGELEDAPYLTPRPFAYGNFSRCGVCLVYVNDPVGVRRTLGFTGPGRPHLPPGRCSLRPRRVAARSPSSRGTATAWSPRSPVRRTPWPRRSTSSAPWGRRTGRSALDSGEEALRLLASPPASGTVYQLGRRTALGLQVRGGAPWRSTAGSGPTICGGRRSVWRRCPRTPRASWSPSTPRRRTVLNRTARP
jgi:NADPH2:quinone reductase